MDSWLSIETVSGTGFDASTYRDFRFVGFAVSGEVRALEPFLGEIQRGLQQTANLTYKIFTPGTIPWMSPKKGSGEPSRQSVSGIRVIFHSDPSAQEVEVASQLILEHLQQEAAFRIILRCYIECLKSARPVPPGIPLQRHAQRELVAV